ncbi:MAG: MoaD/ThiS family protein [Pseudomonadota bacterium]
MAKLVFIGRLRDIAGCTEETAALPAHVRTAGDLLSWISSRSELWAEALAHPAVRVARNQELVAPGDAVADGDELALLPPMSGG